MAAPLARGWHETTSPDGRTYYYDINWQTTWERPVDEVYLRATAGVPSTAAAGGSSPRVASGAGQAAGSVADREPVVLGAAAIAGFPSEGGGGSPPLVAASAGQAAGSRAAAYGAASGSRRARQRRESRRRAATASTVYNVFDAAGEPYWILWARHSAAVAAAAAVQTGGAAEAGVAVRADLVFISDRK